MPSATSHSPTGSAAIDGVLSGIRWSTSSLTYSFPTSGSYYGSGYGSGEPSQGFEAFNANQQAAVRAVLASYSAVSHLTFTEVTETAGTHGDLRFAESNAPETAWAYYPSTHAEGGDAWFNHSDYNTPGKGNYAFLTVLHETGHALGLKHAHEVSGSFGAVPVAQDFLAYTVMSYRSYAGASNTSGYVNGSADFPQSPMMYDIAAIQTIYGANYNINAGNTTYSWSTSTGEMFIDGAAQGAPLGNKVFATLWDGGGSDTYDFSGYETNLTIKLEPGQWSILSPTQIAKLHYNGSIAAPGNIANALLFANDIRSLIENAIGGTAKDVLTGNAAANGLSGGAGDDDLYGGVGNDSLTGGAGSDYLSGGAGTDAAIYSGASSAYSWTKSADGAWRVTDLRAGGPDGSDYLVDMESLQFLDAAILLSQVADTGPVILKGTAGADSLEGGLGNDDLYGNAGDDALFGKGGNDYIHGGAGTDTSVYSAASTNFVWIKNADGSWRVTDQRGGLNDGSDYLLDVELLKFTDTTIALNAVQPSPPPPPPPPNTLIGDAAVNILRGTAASEAIDGLAADDDLYGNGGNDTLTGGAGNDYLDGGAGTDIAVYSASASAYVWSKYSNGAWRVEDQRAGAPDGADYLINVEKLKFSDTTVDLIAVVATPLILKGGDGSEALTGQSGNDDLYGNGGNDTLTGGGGNDYLNGGAGNDTADYSGGSSAYVWSKNADGSWKVSDQRAGTPDGNDYLLDVEQLKFSDKTIELGFSGTAGVDILRGNDAGNAMDGFAADDDLLGFGGNDILTGGAGRDYINGGAGNDISVYAGASSSYSWAQNADGSWRVTDLRAGSPDGSDYLVSVETLQFTDGVINLASAGNFTEMPDNDQADHHVPDNLPVSFDAAESLRSLAYDFLL